MKMNTIDKEKEWKRKQMQTKTQIITSKQTNEQ